MSPIESDGTQFNNEAHTMLPSNSLETMCDKAIGDLYSSLRQEVNVNLKYAQPRFADAMPYASFHGAVRDREVQANLMMVAVTMLNIHAQGTRTYYLNGMGWIDYRDEYQPTSAEADEAVADFEAWSARKNAMEAGSFGSNDDSSSNDEGSK